MTSNIVGIDKISITTTDFKIKTVKEFNVVATIKQGETEAPWLLTDLEKKYVYANKLYRNDKVGKYGMDISTNINSSGLLIHFNPNKFTSPYKLTQPNSNPYKECLIAVKEHLNNIGVVDCNYETMMLCRIDLTKQEEMKLKCYSYQPAFDLLNFKRMKKTVYDGTNCRYTSGSKQYEFYDKIMQLISMKMGDLIEKERNLLRGEVRLTDKKTVSQLIGCNNLYELNKLTPTDFADIYRKDLSKLFDRIKQGEQTVIDYENQIAILNADYSDKGAWIEWLYQLTGSLSKSIELIGGETELKIILKNRGVKNISKALQTIYAKVLRDEKNKKYAKTYNLYDLFDELRLKFAS